MISFIIAARNEEKALPRTLGSLAQYRGPHEIIVADDQSTDASVAVARQYTNAIIENPGPARITISANRNAGAARARGEFFVFADADSYVLDANDFFPRAVHMFHADPRLAALTFFTRFTPSLETWTDRIFLAYFNRSTILWNLLGWGACTGKLHIIRASAFRQVGGYDQSIVAGEDNELFHRLAKVGRTRCARALIAYNSGRRPHAIGWLRLILQWAVNSLSTIIFKRSYSAEWREIR
jgi:glycosyltransferase involved in cell wall biosynthesis